MTTLLDVTSLSVNYGGVRAVRDCSLRVEEGELSPSSARMGRASRRRCAPSWDW